MRNRLPFVIVGLLLVGFGSVGIVFYEQDQARQQTEMQARVTEEQRRLEQERSRAAELQARLDEERNRKLEAERRLLAVEEAQRREEQRDRQKREEERQARRSREEDRGQKPAGPLEGGRKQTAPGQPQPQGESGKKTAPWDGEREDLPPGPYVRRGPGASEPLFPGSPSPDRVIPAPQGGKPSPRQHDGKPPGASPAPQARKEVPAGTSVLRFELDSSREREMEVAHVHVGDRVSIKVRRMSGADRRLYLGMEPVSRSGGRGGRLERRGQERPIAARTRLDDTDHVIIESQPDLGQGLARAVESREGVILRIQLEEERPGRPGVPSNRYRSSPGPARGIYQIEMTISGANPWNIKPRSLL